MVKKIITWLENNLQPVFLEKNMSLIFRELGLNDSKNLFALYQDTLEYLSERFYPKVIIDRIRNDFTHDFIKKSIITKEEGFVFGCFDGKSLVGFIWGWTEETGLLYTDWAGVDKGHFRKGIMTKFLQMSEDFARRKKISKIYFNTYIKNITGANCYLKSGYSVEAVMRNHFFGGDFVQFGKILKKRNWKSKIDEKPDINTSIS